MRTVRLLVVVSILYTSWLLARSVEDFRNPCMDISIGWVVVHGMLLVPYIAVHWLIQMDKLKAGLALALAWAPTTSFWVLPTFVESGAMDTYDNVGSIMLYRWGALFFLVQLALTISAGWTYFKLRRQGKGKLGRALLISIPCITLVVLIGRYSWPVDRYPALKRASVVGYLRRINTAEAIYAAYHQGFSTSLGVLRNPTGESKPSASAADLIDEHLASGTAVGYAFTLVHGQPNSEGHIQTYVVSARPLRRSCGPNYFTDQSVVIRRTAEDRPATAQDPPLE